MTDFQTAAGTKNRDLTVIIVNYRSKHLLKECINSVQTATPGRKIEVIVVNNSPEENCEELSDELSHPAKFIRNERNVGFAAAVNQGVNESSGDYLLLLNPDCRMDAAAVDRLIDFLNSRQEAGAAAPAIMNSDGALQPSRGSFPTLLTSAAYIFNMKRLMPQDETVIKKYGKYLGRIFSQYRDNAALQQVQYATGACLMIKKKIFDRTGGLDQDFFLYYEEIDFCRRMLEEGYSCWYLPDARAVHKIGGSTDDPNAAYRIKLQSMVKYFRKHKPKSKLLILKIMLTLKLMTQMVYAGIARKSQNCPEKRIPDRTFYADLVKWIWGRKRD